MRALSTSMRDLPLLVDAHADTLALTGDPKTKPV
jgi:hypothetical protein